MRELDRRFFVTMRKSSLGRFYETRRVVFMRPDRHPDPIVGQLRLLSGHGTSAASAGSPLKHGAWRNNRMRSASVARAAEVVPAAPLKSAVHQQREIERLPGLPRSMTLTA
jgi:hypothetical protein